MRTNEGTTDRILRAAAGVVALVIALMTGLGSVGGILMLVVAAILLVTAATGFCPLYRAFGLSTCPVDKQ